MLDEQDGSKITNYKYTINDAFRSLHYTIPAYQREYVWEEKQIDLLLNDIKSSYESNRNSEYFIGTTIVSSEKDNNNQYEVIDGQQRITTIFLILCALRSLLPTGENGYDLKQYICTTVTNRNTGRAEQKAKLELNYDGTSDLIKFISQNDKLTVEDIQKYYDNLDLTNKTASVNKIVNAYKYIYEFFEENFGDDIDALGCFMAYLTNYVTFIQIKTDVASALKIFETINERGVGLNPMDLLKNLIFYQVDKSQFEKINSLWKKITQPLEVAHEKPLRFLRYYIMANYTIDSSYKDGVIREEQIFDWFKSNEDKCKYNKEPIELVNKIISNANAYINFTKGKDINGNDNQSLSDFQKLCGGGFSLHNILLLSAVKMPQELFNHLIKQIETLIFYYLITKTSTKELEKIFSKWADELREISSIADTNEQKNKFNNFIEKNFIPAIIEKEEEYQKYFEICALGTLQKYRIKYILAKIAQYVDKHVIGLNLPPKSLNEHYLKLEIEHILPNTQKQDVVENFYNNAEIEATVENKEYDKYKIKLGNLTLLEKPINVIAGCDVLSEKEQQYLNTDVYLTSSIIKLKDIGSQNSSIDKINKYLKKYDLWNDVNIIDRQNLLYNLSKLIWKIELYN
ncbi:DUF262 domain-containing protein [bacterium]|nr:DUF262 domain-containing protein [bacterium]